MPGVLPGCWSYPPGVFPRQFVAGAPFWPPRRQVVTPLQFLHQFCFAGCLQTKLNARLLASPWQTDSRVPRVRYINRGFSEGGPEPTLLGNKQSYCVYFCLGFLPGCCFYPPEAFSSRFRQGRLHGHPGNGLRLQLPLPFVLQVVSRQRELQGYWPNRGELSFCVLAGDPSTGRK